MGGYVSGVSRIPRGVRFPDGGGPSDQTSLELAEPSSVVRSLVSADNPLGKDLRPSRASGREGSREMQCTGSRAYVEEEEVAWIQRSLESSEATWGLAARGLPIWWFSRMGFYASLQQTGGGDSARRGKYEFRRALSPAAVVKAASGLLVLTLRGALGHARCSRLRKSGRCEVLLLSSAASSRERIGNGMQDPFFAPLLRLLGNECAVAERPSMSSWDLDSLLRRRDAFFLDFALLQALLGTGWSLFGRVSPSGWESFCSHVEGQGFPQPTEQAILLAAHEAIQSVARKASLEVAAARLILDSCRPEVLVLTVSYDGFPRAFLYAARERNIPVIELQHGIIHPFHWGYVCFLPPSFRGRSLLPDRLLVWGEAFRDVIVQSGGAFPPEGIRVVGYPRLAEYIARSRDREAVRVRVRQLLRVPEQDLLVTISCQPVSSQFLVTFLLPALVALPERRVTLCLKPHPMEVPTAKQVYSLLLRHPNVRMVTDRQVDLYDLLVASDLHATVASTVLLESLCLGTPSVLIGGPFHQGLLNLLGDGRIPLVSDTAGFLDAVDSLAFDSPGRTAAIDNGLVLGKRLFWTDEAVARRILGEVEECRTWTGRSQP